MYNKRFKKTGLGLFGIVLYSIINTQAIAHLPAFEGERVRNDNHFVKNGFAEPVRGDCDITADGPTDDNAGSANIYLGGDNTPPNFFCSVTTQDDWSFKYPIDIVQHIRVPAPDPSDLGLDIEEGYVPCDPANTDPYQCPRQLTNPLDGSITNLPGQCVDLGHPNDPDPTYSELPDGQYHCALLSGAPRPRENSMLLSTLTGWKDVDWAVYKYDPVFGEQPITAGAQVPACAENLSSVITVAYAGPLGLKDARTGEPLFTPLNRAGDLPKEVVNNLPSNYGIRVTRPDPIYPTPLNPRVGYASGFAQNGWLLAPNSVVECIDNYSKCVEDQTGEFSKHYENNDVFFLDEDENVNLYLMWWVDFDKNEVANLTRKEKRRLKRKLTDVSITTGVIDQWLVGDYINLGYKLPMVANGRYIHGKCTDPRKEDRATIRIETN